MSQKVKDIIFYVVAALFIVIAFTSLILSSCGVLLPTWLGITLAVVEAGLLTAGYFVKSGSKKGE